jgi:NAD(P)-dependent dehydrogenase (short-subunit alcohol dehydrogenase family)
MVGSDVRGEFQDRVTFVTGGAVGFGRSLARGFGAEGACVVIADVDDVMAQETAAELESVGVRAMAVHCDVADESQVDEAVAQVVERFGGVDILFNNAGLHLTRYNQPFSKLERSELRRLLDVNVVGIVNCTLSCQPSMRSRGGGSVVNIASVAANLCLSPYGVSKLAVRGLTVALATELSADGIRVNAISPGLMATENALEDLPEQVIQEQVEKRQLVHRLGTMGDIVAASKFLCSDQAGFITGETLRVSGGFSLAM